MSDSLNYAYYPGCSGTGTSIEYDMSTRAICAKLGITLNEVPDWSCCGSTPAHTVDHTLSSALSARNLALVEKMNLDTAVTPCPSCLTNLKTATHRMSKDEFRDDVNKLLDTPYNGGVDTKSVLQILVEDMGLDALKAKAVKPLKGLKVAAYYGCIMNRPPEVMNFDDPEHPMAMDNILTALGATVLPFPLKVECCGASFGIPRKDIVMSLSGKLLDAAEDIGAEALVTACPLCQMNLDLRQDQINSANGAKHNIPVFYYTQLIGLALGIDEKELGIDKLCVSPRTVINGIGAEDAS
ncbi:CoB--CoM heterodisulfide reductase iron-sulfur subunit B family protein [Maridesulfovibrio frigidus]|uniref:CoB--CoM heterodisulfide reductase iron-sulfur subunit B family protein n=1 Tax=Maridesulfovibrio frigidus TaxID=340956 RepID=UPI0004E289FD|nr:CoB--CoM heterodisulfide reductase iron-sulfur subunit B family protein [Maridesulfovibrio frigidus]